ncbi:GTP 3',8-cyclase MoaA [Alteromonas sp. ASW11-19]|uniref:GTP 3',8-cyclase n=1 Tax=Alteromonas salexigens TaxID=2982530 RepID=A0ABT2VQB7_9ALTE|nr:GTP 3',8-cyclase MoaA [Alteromonas salexigens]MCU7555264.1 GTP 3',8-cyclase MoaA [Alteromonas salexigens]
MLQDNHGRQFHYLRLSVTEACNFRCQYCLPNGYQGPSADQFLNLSEIHTVLTAFAGLGTSKVRLTGGEPSLRRDFTDIIRATASTPGIDEVAMTTHGGRLQKFASEWKAAGLDKVNVSIDSLDPHQFAAITGHDSLKQVLAGLNTAIDAGLNVKVNTVLMSQFSEGRLTRFLEWLKETPVTLRFIELMQTGDQGSFFDNQHQSGVPVRRWLTERGWTPLLRHKAAGPAEEFYHPDYAGRVGLILPYSKDFCKTCNRLRVAANGKIHLCLFSDHGVSLQPYLKEGDVAGLQQYLQQLLVSKEATHHLHEGMTGATSNLAMLGG